MIVNYEEYDLHIYFINVHVVDFDMDFLWCRVPKHHLDQPLSQK